MDLKTFYDEQHELSRRYAVFEDDGKVAYLYLTRPEEPEPVADCWLYNRVPPISQDEVAAYASEGTPPPVAEGYAGPDAVYQGTGVPAATFAWSRDGEAVAVLVSGVPLGCIIHREGRYVSYSRNLQREGPWGNPW